MADENVSWTELKEFCREKQGACTLLREEKERSYLPASRWNTAVMLVSAVGVCVGLFLYLSANSIRDYDMQARDRFVSIPVHDRDIKRIEDRIGAMEARILQGQADLVKTVEHARDKK